MEEVIEQDTLSKAELLEMMQDAIDNKDVKYFAVLIATQGSGGYETIINGRENFEKKMGYYNGAYNDNLILNTFSGIRIIGFGYAKSFAEIEELFSSMLK